MVVWSNAQDVRDGPEVLELVGVGDAAQRLDHAVDHLEREHADDLAFPVRV